MQTPTFSRQVRPTWLSWRNLLLSALLIIGFASEHVRAQAYESNDITITYSTVGGPPTSTLYYGNNGTATTPKFDGSQIAGGAVFSQATGSLILTAATTRFQTTQQSTAISSSQLQYRVYPTGGAVSRYLILDLQNTSPDNFTPTVVFSSPGSNGASGTTSIDLLNQPTVLGAGNYTIDIVYVSKYGSASTTLVDPANTTGIGYRATFQVSAPPITPSNGQSTWISKQSTDWNLAANWSNGVPTATSDAIIPGHDTSDPFTVSPVLEASTTPYSVRTLTLQNSSNPVRATMRVSAGATLAVYGDLNQDGGGLDASSTTRALVADPTRNSTIVFSGANQVIRGTLNAADVQIAGSGVKSVIDVLSALNTITLSPQNPADGVIIQSAKESTNGSNIISVSFDTSLSHFINLSSTGTLFGETNVSYVRGVLKSERALTSGNLETFGNIGLELAPSRDVPNTTLISRVVGAPLTGPTGSSANPIKRQYIVNGDVNNVPTVDVVFHYLDSADELYGIAEENLQLFRTVTGAAPYTSQLGTVDTGKNSLTRLTMTGGVYTVTLGDKNNPLPVSLTAFTATRSNQNALLNWATATEQNNAGFEVQVSTDGTNFSKLAFVASQNPNSAQKLQYSYTDAEAGKTGTRYYRLRQLDITGEESFSPVRVVNFDGSTASTALAAYPNPFTDKLEFNLDATVIGSGVAHVQLLDMTGRVVREQSLAVQNASLSLENLSDLRTGLYMARITLPDGSAKIVRIQKQ